MKRRLGNVICVLICSIAIACNGNEAETSSPITSADSVTKSNPVVSVDSIPSERSSIQEKPVATYSVRTEDPLNEFYFSVKLYETKITHRFLMKLTYETLQVTDTLTVPDLNIWPQPKIEKGASKYECIVGFLNQQQQFKPYKRVFIQNDQLKVKTLHYYRVRGWKKELY